ncbi:MAG TPA: type II toxin-antitoxin system ParD family antitoxin [Planctomycetota bacterium]
MNVSLTRRLEAWVQELVRGGRYQSASEVVRDALRLLEDMRHIQELRLKELRREIAAGLKDLDRGRAAPFDADLLETIKARGRKRLTRRRRA